MISVLVSITALQQRLITLRGGRPHRRWMGGGGWGVVVVGREGQRSKGKKRFKWWRSAAGWMCPQMICARMGGRDGTEGRG